MITAETASFSHRTARRTACLTALTALAGAAIAPLATAQAAGPAPAAALLPCRTVAIADAHGGRITPNSHLALIRHGRVLGLNSDTGAAASIRFSARSGRWAEGAAGVRYAVAGQALTRDGHPGGAYVVAAKRNRDRTVLCAGTSGVWASAADTASVAADSTLAAVGVLEDSASTHNKIGLLANESKQKVCTNTSTHPDGATQVSNPAVGIWCYSGRGAWLNDSQGIERNYDGTPLPGYAHYVEYLGAVVPAAKRPATKPNGEAIPNSAIAWRIYSPSFHNPAGL